MNIKITGKEIKATEAIKSYIEKKMPRIEKYFDEELVVNVTIEVQKNEQIAEIHINIKGETYRAVTAHRDLYASIDKDIDILEGQIRKTKTKREKQIKEGKSFRIEQGSTFSKQEELMEDEVIKTIYYEIKPISVEDAKLKLQEKPKDKFFTFINVDTNKVNVIYKLKDGTNYGLLEPEA